MTLSLAHYITFSNDRNKWNKYEDAVFDALDAHRKFIASESERSAARRIWLSFHISAHRRKKQAKQKTSGMLFHSIPLCLWRLSLHYPRPNGFSPFPLVSMAVGRLFHSARRHTARFVRTGASIVTNKSRQILLSLTMWLRHTLRHVVPYLLAYAICMCEIPCERVRAFDAIIMR